MGKTVPGLLGVEEPCRSNPWCFLLLRPQRGLAPQILHEFHKLWCLGITGLAPQRCFNSPWAKWGFKPQPFWSWAPTSCLYSSALANAKRAQKPKRLRNSAAHTLQTGHDFSCKASLLHLEVDQPPTAGFPGWRITESQNYPFTFSNSC